MIDHLRDRANAEAEKRNEINRKLRGKHRLTSSQVFALEIELGEQKTLCNRIAVAITVLQAEAAKLYK